MLLNKIGEFGLIERIKKSIRLDASVIRGSGDDCAVLKLDKKRYQLFTCDMLVQGVDFKPNASAYLIGRKALGVSISDIAACGGYPRHSLVSMGIPKRSSVGFIDRLMRGMLFLADEYKINIVGGDISRAPRLTIDVSMLGVVEKKNLVLRSGAKKGDIIFVTGTLGGSIRGKHFRFIPRVKEARYLVNNFPVHAMIDISDGLALDVSHILKESRVGAVIYEDLIPLSPEAHTIQEALYMGEDFELLFSVDAATAKKIYQSSAGVFKPIGSIMDKKYGLKLVDKSGKVRTLRPKGFRHF